MKGGNQQEKFKIPMIAGHTGLILIDLTVRYSRLSKQMHQCPLILCVK